MPTVTPMTSNKVTDDLKVVLGHLRRTLRSLADEVRPVAPGLLMRTRSLPRVWSLNQVRITQVAEFSEVLGLAAGTRRTFSTATSLRRRSPQGLCWPVPSRPQVGRSSGKC